MQIECPSCKKKFNVDDSLIPDQGRLLQCGFCDHKWFFKKKEIINEKSSTQSSPTVKILPDVKIPKDIEIIINQAEEEKRKPINKETNQSTHTFNKKITIKKDQNLIGRIFSYIVVGIVSFVALIILLDTFKSPLSEIFPKLDYLLLSLYETLKDIQLFITDLI
tara:strand:- start:1019 stop:1510 length:492 start_codon:yes stop_codon:yes gene_type:complete